ncbi:MAG: Ig-like domain-containing protein [bacterium]|nr:Ig-like domain-containing protein [bacterium]MDY4100417.1 Ig-like domain-containing protein [Lachnospiraceae bacterium]
MKRNILKKLFIFLMAIMLVLPVFSGLEVQAAAKPSLSETKKVIAIGTYGYAGETTPAFSERLGKYSIHVQNSKKGATYTFTSSNKKVATVKASKTTGYLTGIKAGTTTITVKQKLKGKTTTVGTCKVTVKNATVKASAETSKELLSVGTGTWFYSDGTEPICVIENMNPKATYTFVSNSKDFRMSQKLMSMPVWGDDFYVYAQTYTAKKAGTYTVTVKETYKKKTKTLGKIKVKVHDNGLREDNVTLPVGGDLNLQDLLKYYNGGWVVDCDEEDILEEGEPDWNGNPTVRAIKPGTAKLKFSYKDFEENKLGEQFGVCTVTVVEVKVADIRLEEEIINVCEDDQGYDPLNYKYTLITAPEDFYYNGEVTFTSSDEKVVSIGSEGTCQIEGAGTATVTITAGDVSKTVTVNVLTADEYYNLSDEEEDW